MDAASIEEANRIRVSLGMKPLPVPNAEPADSEPSEDEADKASTLETRQAEGYENYKKMQDAEVAKKKRQDRADAIRKAREKAQRFAQLEGKGLADDDGTGQDAKSWLLGQKKRQKQIEKARKLEEELAAAEAEAAAAVQYTSRDLAGISIAHDSSAFLDGDDQILTLKDSMINGDDDEDELENMDMRDQEKREDRMKLKKKVGYNPMDDDDAPKGILSHYDEEIEGKKNKKFTLDKDGAIGELAAIMEEPTQEARKAQAVSLDDIVGDDAGPSSDYIDASQIKTKKKKSKKSKKGTRQKQFDEDDIFPTTEPTEEKMDVDIAPSRKRSAIDDDFGDDEDLQASLAAQRRNALKKRKKMKPEDFAKQLKEQAEEEESSVPAQEGGLVIDGTSEFIAGLVKPEDDEERKPKGRKATTATPEPKADADGDEEMADSNNAYLPTREENQLLEAANRAEEAQEEDVLDEEKTVGQGMGAALALLRERGILNEGDATTYEAHRAREEFLAQKRLLETQLDEQTRLSRERDRANGKLDRMSQREREEWARKENQRRDWEQSKRMADLINKTYKPKVNITHTDEHGRSLNQKEAFKQMSHQFHGKGSGKGKTEKTLKKIEGEKKKEAQSLFDASAAPGMVSAAQQQVKKRKEAGVRLQ